MNLPKLLFLVAWLFAAAAVHAELAVTVGPPKATGSKAIVKLDMKNGFPEKIEAARVVVFLLDGQGKIVGQPTTRWVIGGSNTNGLAPGATNAFHFVIASDKPFATTNLAARVQFNLVVLGNGKLADVTKDVKIESR
jgi:hypothetical protein